MTRDPSIIATSKKESAQKRIQEIRKEYPNDFWYMVEWRELNRIVREANREITHIQRMKDRGVKF